MPTGHQLVPSDTKVTPRGANASLSSTTVPAAEPVTLHSALPVAIRRTVTTRSTFLLAVGSAWLGAPAETLQVAAQVGVVTRQRAQV